MNAKEIIEKVDEIEQTDFVTPNFGSNWPTYIKQYHEIDDVISIAHKQGRRAILLERAIYDLVAEVARLKAENATLQSINKTNMQSLESISIECKQLKAERKEEFLNCWMASAEDKLNFIQWYTQTYPSQP